MKFNIILAIAMFSFSNFALALAVDEWTYKNVTGDMKPGPGCVDKEKAIAKVVKKPDSYKGYSRFKKYARLLCEEQGYGWGLESVINEGEVECTECGGDYAGKYRCQVKNVTVKCKQVAR